jgi:hypothetical protein
MRSDLLEQPIKVGYAGFTTVKLYVAGIARGPRGLIASPVKAAKAWLGPAVVLRGVAFLILGPVELAVDVGPAAVRPCLDLVRHAVEGSKAGLGVGLPVAGALIDRGILVDVDRGIEPVDQALDLVAGGPADSPKRLKENFGGNSAPADSAGRSRGVFADVFVGGVLYTLSAWVIGLHLRMAWVRAGAEVSASPRLAILVNLIYGKVN